MTMRNATWRRQTVFSKHVPKDDRFISSCWERQKNTGLFMRKHTQLQNSRCHGRMSMDLVASVFAGTPKQPIPFDSFHEAGNKPFCELDPVERPPKKAATEEAPSACSAQAPRRSRTLVRHMTCWSECWLSDEVCHILVHMPLERRASVATQFLNCEARVPPIPRINSVKKFLCHRA